MRGLRKHVTPEVLRLRAGDRTYRRGRDYADEGRVSAIVEDGPALTGVVEGTLDYEVVLEAEGDELVATCDCPMGETGAFCKHVVALGLAWLVQAGEPADPGPRAPVRGGPPPRRITTEDVRSHLAAMDHGALVDLVVAPAERDELLRERLALLVATAEADGAGADLVRRAIDKAVRVPGFLRYADVYGYVVGVHGAIDPRRRPLGPSRIRRHGLTVSSCALEPLGGLWRLCEPHRDRKVVRGGASPGLALSPRHQILQHPRVSRVLGVGPLTPPAESASCPD